jgi:hypothetical protein
VTQLVIPPIGAGQPLGSVRGWQDRWQARWGEAQPRTRTTVQLVVLFGAIAVAYSYSLLTLFQNAEMQTPLAYISLVPVIALALAVVNRRPERAEPALDRHGAGDQHAAS